MIQFRSSSRRVFLVTGGSIDAVWRHSCLVENRGQGGMDIWSERALSNCKSAFPPVGLGTRESLHVSSEMFWWDVEVPGRRRVAMPEGTWLTSSIVGMEGSRQYLRIVSGRLQCVCDSASFAGALAGLGLG